ncbi:MAG: APC family permease [Terriglobales bacterium]
MTDPVAIAERKDRTTEAEFVKGIGLTSATTIVIGSMIGSGIFIVSADIARVVGSPALLIATWVITGIMTMAASLVYGELAAMMPKAGGEYIFLRESLGPLWAFLYGWTLFLVIQPGTIAAVGIAFGKYLGHFFPAISSSNWILHLWKVPAIPVMHGKIVLGDMEVGLNTQNLVAIITIVLLSAINVFGVKTGALVQNVFTFTKTAALIGLGLLGFFVARNHEAIAANFSGGHFWHNAGWATLHQISVGGGMETALVGLVTALAIAQVGSLFAADGWQGVTFAAAEVENPQRNLPLALVLGTATVMLIYIAVNFSYMLTLPLHGDPNAATIAARGIQYATEDRVATAVMSQMFGAAGASLIALAILISTFGCNNGLILAGARVYYAMAKDGMFFKPVSKLHPKYRTPAISLGAQAVWATVLCLSGSYGQLLDYTIFALLLFYILNMVALFVLRKTRPDAPRPYKTLLYPWLPILYVVMAGFICLSLLRYKPQYTWPGLAIVLLGVPVYLLTRPTPVESTALAGRTVEDNPPGS